MTIIGEYNGVLRSRMLGIVPFHCHKISLWWFWSTVARWYFFQEMPVCSVHLNGWILYVQDSCDVTTHFVAYNHAWSLQQGSSMIWVTIFLRIHAHPSSMLLWCLWTTFRDVNRRWAIMDESSVRCENPTPTKPTLYNIVPNKRAGHRGRIRALRLIQF